MRYELDIPDDVDQQLTVQANAAGQDKVHYLQTVISWLIRSGVRQVERDRLPDAPLEEREISAPFDLPRSGKQLVAPFRSDRESKRLPDPTLE